MANLHGLTKDITNKRFGKLTAIHPLHRSNHNRLEWFCKCDCGKTKIIRSNRLLNGTTKSCGCIQYKSRLLPGSIGSFRQLYRNYIFGAKIRNLTFNLSYVQFLILTSMDCYYCGDIPKPFYSTNRKNNVIPYIANGIDRIDNTIGYEFYNCVPCCSICNIMKQGSNEYDFVNKCASIAVRSGVCQIAL
jgi:hypothetical protein